MDLSGRSPAYRGSALRCPACGALMRRDVTETTELEVCDACEGLWVDWFDGDVHAVAAEHEAARLDRGTAPPSRPSAPPSGSQACPRCTRPLVAELYRFADAAEHELVTGVELLRCADCAGAFVTRASAHLLLDRALEPRVPSRWDALLAILARWLPAR